MGSWLTFRVNVVIWRIPLNSSLTFHTGVDLYVSVCMYTCTQVCACTMHVLQSTSTLMHVHVYTDVCTIDVCLSAHPWFLLKAGKVLICSRWKQSVPGTPPRGLNSEQSRPSPPLSRHRVPPGHVHVASAWCFVLKHLRLGTKEC